MELEMLKESHSKVRSEYAAVIDKLTGSERRVHTLQSSLGKLKSIIVT